MLRRAQAGRAARAIAAVAAVVLAGCVAACGGATQKAAAAASGDVVRYCALSQVVNTSGVAPTPTQVNDLIRLAPPEIRGDVTTFLSSADASDTGVQAFTRILDFESAHC